MTTDDLSPAEHRITHGIDQLVRSAAAWLAGADAEEHRTRTALGRALGGGIAAWVVGGVAYELGPIAWGSAGVLAGLSVWVAGAPEPTEDQDDEPGLDDRDDDGEPEDEQLLDADLFADTIHAVARGGNVHLTAVARRLHAETGRHWDVLAACRAHGITTKPVRVAGADPAVTTGIHRTDLPPLPRDEHAPVGVVSAGHPDNNNTNNEVTVEAIGEPGRLIKHRLSTRQEARR